MQRRNMTIGQDYAFGTWKSERLGSSGAYRGTLLRFEGTKAVFASKGWGKEKSVILAMVLGTWDEHLAAKAEAAKIQAERYARQDGEVYERNEARKALRALLGKDWAKDFGYGLDTKAKVHNDRSGIHGGATGGRHDEVTTVQILALVQQAYDIGYADARAHYSDEG